MPKRVLDLRDFSGGINSRINKTEINDNDVTKSVGLMYDIPGIIRGIGKTTALKYDETNAVPSISDSNYSVGASNGYGLGYVSFDAPSQVYVIHTSADVSVLTLGNYLSNDSSGGDWDTTETHFVLKIFAVDNTDDSNGARQIWCYLIKTGSSTTSIFDVANSVVDGDVTLYESANADGGTPTTRSALWADTGFTELIGSDDATFHASNPLNWQFHLPNIAWTQPWTITGGNLVLNATSFAGGSSVFLGTFTSPGIIPNNLYQVKITFSADLNTGNLAIILNGKVQAFQASDIDSNVATIICTAGTIGYPNHLGGLWITSLGSIGQTATITDISLKLHVHQYGNLGDLNASTTSQHALVYTDSYTQKVKYFSYEMGTFTDILVDSATVENTKEPLVLKDDDGAVTSEISPIIYSIEGAVRIVEANFKSLKAGTSTARAPFESKYIKYINRKYFNDAIEYLEWVAEPSDIDEPTNGIIKFDGSPLYEGQMQDGFINMLAYRGVASQNKVLHKEFIGVDGCYAGAKDMRTKKQLFPIVASKWDLISNDTAPIPPLPDGTAAKGCVGFFKRDATTQRTYFQYHGGIDGTLGPDEAFDNVIDLTNPNSGAILVTLYISPNALADLKEDESLRIYIGNAGDAPGGTGAAFDETFDGDLEASNIAMAYYEYQKSQLSAGWTTFKLEKNKYSDIIGAYDPKNIKDIFIAFKQRPVNWAHPTWMDGYAYDQLTLDTVDPSGNDKPAYAHQYLFYFVGPDGGDENAQTVNDVDYDSTSYINKVYTMGEDGSTVDGENPAVRKFFLKNSDYYEISSAITYPNGSFDGEGNARWYRNKATLVLTEDDGTALNASGKSITYHFQPGDLVLILREEDADDTNEVLTYTANKQGCFCACVDSVDASANSITITLPSEKQEILGTRIGYNWFDITDFIYTDSGGTLNGARLYKNPNLPNNSNNRGPICHHLSNTDSSNDETPSGTVTGIGDENFTYNPVPFAIAHIAYEKASEGNWDGKYSFYYSFIYDDNQESKMYEFKSLSSNYADGTLPSNEIELKQEMLYLSFCLKEASITGGWNHATAGRKRINKANIYYSRILEDAESGDTSYYFLGELDLNEGFRLSGTTKHNLFQEVNSGSFRSPNLACSASDITYTDDASGDIIKSKQDQLDFSKFFNVGDRIKVATETTNLTGSTVNSDGDYEVEVTINSISSDGGTNNKIVVNEGITGAGESAEQNATFTYMGVYDTFKAISSSDPIQSTATITVTGNLTGDGETFTLTDADGNAATFQIVTGSTEADGRKIGSNIQVGVSGVSGNEDFAHQITTAINGVTSYNNSMTLHITANDNQVTEGEIKLTQDIVGKEGDTIIETTGLTNATLSSSFTGNTNSSIDYNDLRPVQIESPPMIDVFETRALYKNDTEYTSAKYKTHTINNGIVYAGNVMQGGVIYPDRILKSLPSRPDLFPSDNYIEVAVNDGDEIVALESFNDRILQFKTGSLSIINVSGAVEYLENKYEYLGVKSVMAVSKTDRGVIFANKSGVYIFIGEGEPTKLTSKLSDNDWSTFVDGKADKLALLYTPLKDQIMVGSTHTQDAYIIDLRTQSISFGKDIFLLGDQTTNIVYDTTNNQPVFLSEASNTLNFYTLYNSEDDTYLASVTHDLTEPATTSDIASVHGMAVEFKHLDFGFPEVRKKIRSISITSKDSDGQLKFQYSTDLGNSWADIGADEAASTITDYAGNRGSYSRQRFDVSINNIYTFGLRIVPTGTHSSKAADFSVQDISIVYRLKNVK